MDPGQDCMQSAKSARHVLPAKIGTAVHLRQLPSSYLAALKLTAKHTGLCSAYLTHLQRWKNYSMSIFWGPTAGFRDYGRDEPS